jgi:hypothetical protein
LKRLSFSDTIDCGFLCLPACLQIKQFTQFPVVASSYSNRITQAVEDLSCKLWIPCGAADEAAGIASDGAAAPAAASQVVPSAIALETLFED